MFLVLISMSSDIELAIFAFIESRGARTATYFRWVVTEQMKRSINLIEKLWRVKWMVLAKRQEWSRERTWSKLRPMWLRWACRVIFINAKLLLPVGASLYHHNLSLLIPGCVFFFEGAESSTHSARAQFTFKSRKTENSCSFSFSFVARSYSKPWLRDLQPYGPVPRCRRGYIYYALSLSVYVYIAKKYIIFFNSSTHGCFNYEWLPANRLSTCKRDVWSKRPITLFLMGENWHASIACILQIWDIIVACTRTKLKVRCNMRVYLHASKYILHTKGLHAITIGMKSHHLPCLAQWVFCR